MKKVKLFSNIIVMIILCILILKYIIPKVTEQKFVLRKSVYSFLLHEKNRKDVFSRAVELHYGDITNTCVYFASEVLRRNTFEVPEEICNTAELIDFLEEKGWKKEYSHKKLQSGDLCFTTDEFGNKNGTPTHTYIFMGWVEEDKYDYAYICDNQAKDYENKLYHIRNICVTDEVDGEVKDVFSFFMHCREAEKNIKNSFKVRGSI